LAKAEGPSSSAVANEIGWSRRHFARRFRDSTGFSPDRFRRIARFQRFVGGLTGAPGDDLAGLAVDSGYADQPHLARDVRDFTGMTPGELRARLVPERGGSSTAESQVYKIGCARRGRWWAKGVRP
jgi:AraC-like DNA-binding protein